MDRDYLTNCQPGLACQECHADHDMRAPALDDHGDGAHPELLVSAALHLMSHYSAQASQAGACVKLASVIERHLRALAGHAGIAPVLRATCEQLSGQWATVVENATPHPTRPTLFGRLLHGARGH